MSGSTLCGSQTEAAGTLRRLIGLAAESVGLSRKDPSSHWFRGAAPDPFFFFFTLVTGPRRFLSLELSDTRVHEPQIRARLCQTRGWTRPRSCPTLLPSTNLKKTSVQDNTEVEEGPAKEVFSKYVCHSLDFGREHPGEVRQRTSGPSCNQ